MWNCVAGMMAARFSFIFYKLFTSLNLFVTLALFFKCKRTTVASLQYCFVPLVRIV